MWMDGNLRYVSDSIFLRVVDSSVSLMRLEILSCSLQTQMSLRIIHRPPTLQKILRKSTIPIHAYKNKNNIRPRKLYLLHRVQHVVILMLLSWERLVSSFKSLCRFVLTNFLSQITLDPQRITDFPLFQIFHPLPQPTWGQSR